MKSRGYASICLHIKHLYLVTFTILTGVLINQTFKQSWQSLWDLPAMMAVDLYSGLKGQRLRPSSVTISPVSLLTRVKSAVFWRKHTHTTCSVEKKTCDLVWQWQLQVRPTVTSQFSDKGEGQVISVSHSLFSDGEKDWQLDRFLIQYHLITCMKYYDPIPIATGDDIITALTLLLIEPKTDCWVNWEQEAASMPHESSSL